jgi:hypothetical protein
VERVAKDGKRFRLGTDEPEALFQAIETRKKMGACPPALPDASLLTLDTGCGLAANNFLSVVPAQPRAGKQNVEQRRKNVLVRILAIWRMLATGLMLWATSAMSEQNFTIILFDAAYFGYVSR